MTPSLLDYPALNGRPVTQAHADMCTDRGHAVHTVEGVAQLHCPRCGDPCESQCTEPARNARFEAILQLEENLKGHQLSASMGVTPWDRVRGATYAPQARAALSAAVDALTLDEMAAYGAYRAAAYGYAPA